jgi:hypothetical protein
MNSGPVSHTRIGALRRWLGPNRNTHWTTAGAVAVIVLGSYLVYSIRDGAQTTVAPNSMAEQTLAPTVPAPAPADRMK